MTGLYEDDLAYIHAVGFSALAAGAAPEIIRRLRAAQCDVRDVIDAGCGAGILTRALLESGYRATAVDTSAHLLEHARRAAPEARFIRGSVYDIDLRGHQAIIALGEVLTYHSPGDDALARVAAFFERASDALPPGGLLIFDIIRTGEPTLAGRNWVAGEDWAVLVETAEDESARSLTRSIETFRRIGGLYRRRRERHPVRLFDRSWIIERLTACGFSVETATQYGDQPLASRRCAFFAAKDSTRSSGA